MTIRNPLARLSRLRSSAFVMDYGLWKLHRLEDRFPRRTDRRLRPLRSDLRTALAQATGADDASIQRAREEFRAFAQLIQPYGNLYAVADPHLTELQYVVTRLLKPRVAVETGVWRGLSSWTMLAAMQRSGVGTLVSIDFPPLEESQQVEVGHLVPQELRSRWDLRLGPSRQLLPQVLAEQGPIDLFVHDSDHTFFNMTREFSLGWDSLVPGGVLLSDDIDANHSFVKFARKAAAAPIVVAKANRDGYLGILARPRPPAEAAERVRPGAVAGSSAPGR